jgi:hypothetical protein
MTAKINIVIPTRERHDTLLHCLRTAIAQDHDNLAIIVSDNASGPATREVVESFGDPRIRYVNTGKRVSMAHNYEFALSHVEDGWIVMVGDDDGLLPGRLVPAVEQLEASGLEAMSTETCGYNWPSTDTSNLSILSVPLSHGARRVNSKQAIRDAMRWRWHRFRMPQTYTGGIVSAALFQRIKAIKGTFFQSQIPDIYSGYAITSVTDEFLFEQAPFAIAGKSGHSIGEALFKLQKPSFLDEGLIPFHEDFPMPEQGTLAFSFPAIVCESYLQSSFLHHDVARVSHADMLTLILGQAREGKELLPAWGRVFAARHGLDYDAIVERARRPDLGARAHHEYGRAVNFLTRYRIDASHGLSIDNVYDAAVVSDTVLRTRPGRLRNWAQVARRTRGKPGWH